MGTSIWQARKDGWTITLTCHRQREGLKSVRPCQGEARVHLSTLIAALGPDVELEQLQKVLRCPGCGTDRVELRLARQPSPGAGAKDAERPRRKMRPAAGSAIITLGNTPERWIVFVCDRCGRRGEYARERLLEEFDSTIDLPSFLAIFAHSRGCGLAIPHPTQFDLARNRECRIRYDVER
jgi:hypothetical protein